MVRLLLGRLWECPGDKLSEAWGPPRFQEKRSRSEKAILGALGEFRGILGAAPGIRNSILGIRNSILGMASHDLSNYTKTTILRATPRAIPGIDGGPTRKIFIWPCVLGAFIQKLGLSPRCARLKLGKPQRWERAHVGFGGTGRKRKGACTKQCAWRKHALCDTRLTEACPTKLRNTAKYRVEEVRPKWPFCKVSQQPGLSLGQTHLVRKDYHQSFAQPDFRAH